MEKRFQPPLIHLSQGKPTEYTLGPPNARFPIVLFWSGEPSFFWGEHLSEGNKGNLHHQSHLSGPA